MTLVVPIDPIIAAEGIPCTRTWCFLHTICIYTPQQSGGLPVCNVKGYTDVKYYKYFTNPISIMILHNISC